MVKRKILLLVILGIQLMFLLGGLFLLFFDEVSSAKQYSTFSILIFAPAFVFSAFNSYRFFLKD